MNRITQDSDGSWHWNCPIDPSYHRKSGRAGLAAVILICAAVLIIFLITSNGSMAQQDTWIPVLVIGVILLIALPLLFLWNTADAPHEQYVMTEDYVKSGYGRGAIYSQFKKTKEAVVSAKYLELCGNYKNNRIYVPPEDMDLVRDFILNHLPEDVLIRYE